MVRRSSMRLVDACASGSKRGSEGREAEVDWLTMRWLIGAQRGRCAGRLTPAWLRRIGRTPFRFALLLRRCPLALTLRHRGCCGWLEE